MIAENKFPEPDLGADGPAMQARPSRMVSVGAQYRGSVSPALEEQARRYADATLFDRMWLVGQLSDRQHRAAKRIAWIWTAAGLDPRMTADYPAVPEIVGDADGSEESDLEEGETWRDVYRSHLRAVGGLRATLVDAMLLGQHPGTWRLATLQSGLDALGDWWGYERVKSS